MSDSRYCEFWNDTNGKWWLDLAPHGKNSDRDYDYDGDDGGYDGSPDGEYEASNTYGPFGSQRAAEEYLHKNFSNPGSDSVDDSGSRQPPTKSPNGGPIIRPGGAGAFSLGSVGRGLGSSSKPWSDTAKQRSAERMAADAVKDVRRSGGTVPWDVPKAPASVTKAAKAAPAAVPANTHRGTSTARKTYPGGKGKPPVARLKGKLYRAPQDTKTSAGQSYPMKPHGDKLMVAAPGRNQIWEPEAQKKSQKESLLRQYVREALLIESVDDDVNSIEVGDMVDVDMEYMGTLPVRVIELIDNVEDHVGNEDDGNPAWREMKGPGFLGEIDPSSGESGQLVFALDQVVQGSKAKYFFPKLGAELEDGTYADWDEYGRDVANPYRKMAGRQVTRSREPG